MVPEEDGMNACFIIFSGAAALQVLSDGKELSGAILDLYIWTPVT